MDRKTLLNLEEKNLIQLNKDLKSVISERTCDIIRKYPPVIDTRTGRKFPHFADFTDTELEIIRLSDSGFGPFADKEIRRRYYSKVND